MVFFWRLLLVVVAAFLAWRIASYGIAEHYLEQAEDAGTPAIDRALSWNPRHPDALYRKGRSIREKDPAGSSNLFEQSFAEKPTSSFPLLALADIAQEADEQDRATALIEESVKLMRANPPVRIAAGGYWARKGNLETAMTHWSEALVAGADASETLFPILLELAKEPRTIGLFRSVAASPPTWWERFFRQATMRIPDLETVRTLYAFRRASGAPPLSPKERELYVRRLQKDGKTTEAYLVWVNGLDETGRSQLGILNNGGFEIEPTNSGFDWHIHSDDHTTATTAATAGTEGKKALHLIFKRREKQFWHLHQPLFLDPGTYRVKGMARTDSLDSKGGLKWVVRCMRPEILVLGESERFLGSSEWRDFSFEAAVPPECSAQEIRLVSAGKRQFEHKMTGGVWFDAISMRKIPGEQTPVVPSVSNSPPPGKVGSPLVDGAFDVHEVTGSREFSFEQSLNDSLRKSDD